MTKQSTAAAFTAEDLSCCHVLVVDDSRLSRDVIHACLGEAGYKNISLAEDGFEALKIIDRKLPDLVILDLEMPGMDGFELCRRLRAEPATSVVPVLIQSGHDSPDDTTRAFAAGASDKIVKPVKKFDLLARVRVHLENRQLVGKLTAYHDRVAQELESARGMQRMLCPAPSLIASLRRRFDIDVQSHFEPCSELGGDSWGLREIDERYLGFYIADFSGHGIGSALNTFRLHTLIERLRVTPDDPAGMLGHLNERLADLLDPGTFATMLLGWIDLETETLCYASAGAPPPLYLGPATNGECQSCDSRGMPLGIRQSWEYRNHSLPFTPGSWIMLYSDALIETENADGTVLEEEGLRRLVDKYASDASSEGLFGAILGEFKAAADNRIVDDLTVLMIGRPAATADCRPRALT